MLSMAEQKTNGHLFEVTSKSSFLTQFNNTIDYKRFRIFAFVFLVFQGRTKAHDNLLKFASKSSVLSNVGETVV